MRAFGLLLLLLSGCATLPSVHKFESQRDFDVKSDLVWAGLMSYFTENKFQIKTIEKDSGVVYSELIYAGMGEGFDKLADCGIYPLEQPSQGSIALNVFVQRSELTTVSVNTTFNRQWGTPTWGGPRFSWRPYASKGTLEKIILDYIDFYLMQQ